MSAMPARLLPFRNWEAAFLLALCVLAGIGALVAPATVTPNFEAAMPRWVVTMWGVSLLAGGGIALTGVLWPSPRAAGLLVWRAGLLPLFGACVAYPVELLLVGGTAAAERAGTTLVFGAVVLARIVNITQTIRVVTQESREQAAAAPAEGGPP